MSVDYRLDFRKNSYDIARREREELIKAQETIKQLRNKLKENNIADDECTCSSCRN